MNSSQEAQGLENNLLALQAESLTIINLFVGGIGLVWTFWVVWPVTGASASLSAWGGVMLLLASVAVSQWLKEKHLPVATHLFVYGMLGSAACAVLSFKEAIFLYLFILPIIFASVLLRRQGLFLGATILAILGVLGVLNQELLSFSGGQSVALSLLVITLVTIASWLSARNLYIALEWMWNAFESSQRSEQFALDQQAELRRVLKALDESVYRIQRTNHMLALARNQAEEARRLKQQFAQTISHELRTPINLIVGFTELMVQSPEHYGGGQLPPAYIRDLSIVNRNASHLQTLINDVLDLARIEAAQMNLVLQETDPLALVQEAANTVRSLVDMRGLALHLELPPALPLIWADATRIRQVLFNLINNAIRFTERGSITLSAGKLGQEIIFAVKDTGIGIPPEKTTYIFEEFQQLDGTMQRPHEGSGLGLAISQRFVKLHRGRIWVESQPGQGSTFYFSLPLRPTDLEPISGDRLPKEASLMPGSADEEPIQLAITRSPSAAALLTRYIHGSRIVIVQDIQQARQMVRQLIPQVVIIDNANQELESADLRELAESWAIPQTFFIECPLPGENLLRQQLAVNGYLVKPVARQTLWDMVRQFGENIDKILIVDDDRDFARLLRQMLESRVRRYQISSASSGKEAIEKMHYRQPDLVLLDLMLPDVSGMELIERIRSSANWRHIPIVVISAYEELDNLKTTGTTMTIAKANGLKPGEIVQCIQGLLDKTSPLGPLLA